MGSYFVGNLCDYKVNCTAFKKSRGVVWQDRHLPYASKVARSLSHWFPWLSLHEHAHLASSRVRKLRYARCLPERHQGFSSSIVSSCLLDCFILIPVRGSSFPAIVKATLLVAGFLKGAGLVVRGQTAVAHRFFSCILCWALRTSG